MKRIVVDPPSSEARRDRIERKLFEQLAAVRMVERAEAVIPPARKNRRPMWLAAGALAAAAVLAVVLLGQGTPTEPNVQTASRVVTPIGGTTQFTVPGALIEARSDTSVEVLHGANGAVTLVIGRGTIDCDVEHRENRPPFRVVAGEVSVEVVGTRFSVTRSPKPRVDVARGKVRVTAPGGQWLVEAGEAWPTLTQTAAAAPPPAAPEPEPEIAPEIEMAPHVVGSLRKKPTVTPPAPPATAKEEATTAERDLAQETYRIANKLEHSDPHKAAKLYRSIATNGKGMESVALVSLAEVELRLRHPAEALAALDELRRRFPNAANTEDAAWFRYEALRTMGKRDEARGAAADYLRQFPHGAYADRLQSQP